MRVTRWADTHRSPSYAAGLTHGCLGPARRVSVISGSLHLKWHRIWSQVAAGPRSPARQAGPTLLPLMLQSIWLLIACLAATWQNDTVADEATNAGQNRISVICQNLQSATVRLRSGSDVSSGVVVSKNGLILTVAHGLKSSSGKVIVLLPSGKSCEAKPVVVDEAADVALLKMDVGSLPNAEWNTVPMSAAAQARVGDVVLAAGFPARERDGLAAVVRLGQILPVDKSVPMSSCTLTSGDSGGPLVNSRGELIGLNRQIGAGLEANGHIPLTVIRKVLEQSRHWSSLTGQTKPLKDALLLPAELKTVASRIDSSHRAAVEILGGNAGGVPVVRSLGTVLNARQVATKLSQIFPYRRLECQWADGQSIAATLQRFDRQSDLAILELADPYDAGNDVEAAIRKSRNSSLVAGRIVFAATSPTDFAEPGILSRVGHDEASLPAKFGAAMRADNERLRIIELSPNGSALQAGLMIGDELRQIDEIDITSLQAVADVFGIRQPGDWLTLGILRDTEALALSAQLQHDPSLKFEKTEFLDGRTGRVSLRRSGFKGLLQHDCVIEPKACGGPLFDINGQLIAINTARRARESTLAVPIGDVLKLAADADKP